ncbi:MULTISPECIES: hypothetical protein [unclassified Oleiphilus]|uniref:hypothetical protein n=1 Tax=unclassified Oleiphilus TaxID=2631174 RepID=UPI0007C31A39|nr:MULTISPECIES: hypothetical protein [unclassified Oleiphilus]KZY45817.1 hypothetical protein A3732_09215 [Oleiphilus sp. HI0050]KZY85168.1 hypothetical protein A3743_19645 [Oleiphilus sp. HI0072]KZZ27986.1 hypothetical protein A3752_04180 [Oleiphilus sp. HI0081]KZY39558.1 hypothetical protein A3729_14945 [Oleiphilus sp. HI0043]KZZ32241.1 hypothetical protein A3757_20850 [Oleiphilus sp. HI0117]
MLRLLFILLTALTLDACTSLSHLKAPIAKKHVEQKTKTPASENIEELCKYTSHKGISELISVKGAYLTFIFFPGNVEFRLEKEKFPLQKLIGSEFKAIYEELVQGHAKCHKPAPQIIGLPH